MIATGDTSAPQAADSRRGRISSSSSSRQARTEILRARASGNRFLPSLVLAPPLH